MNKSLLFLTLSTALLSHLTTFTDQPKISKTVLFESPKEFFEPNKKQREINTLEVQKQNLINKLINNLMRQVNNFNEFQNSGDYGPARRGEIDFNKIKKNKRPDDISKLNDEITKIQKDIATLQEISQGGSLDVTQLLEKRIASMKHMLMSEK